MLALSMAVLDSVIAADWVVVLDGVAVDVTVA